MKRKALIVSGFCLLALVFGMLGAVIINKWDKKNETVFLQSGKTGFTETALTANGKAAAVDFVEASEKCRPTVVFIKSIKEGAQQSYFFWDMFSDFFNNMGPSTSSGSGVIISEDGYIVTNTHVVKDADRIEVVVNNRKKNYKAEVIGLDPSSDLALLKIDEKNLSFAEFGNSDQLLVGDWVLAIGNPFNLTSTVTSGIVSAKGRNIKISNNTFPIESFIQTDAAINPGNSGGALVSLNGKLVGINTAILSRTGSYAGYGFAIPSNIVLKIVNDLRKYGFVQRALIEAEVVDIDEDISNRLKLEDIQGVYVNRVTELSNASKAGVKTGDVILKVNDKVVNSRSSYDEQLAYYYPGDKAILEILRDGKMLNLTVILSNAEGNTTILKNTTINSKKLGASFTNLTKAEKDYFGLDYGVKVSSVKNGMIAQMNLPEGYIILSINKKNYSAAQELVNDLEVIKGWITIKGVTNEGWLDTRTFRIY